MKTVVIIILLCLAMFRVALWRASQESALSICHGLSSAKEMQLLGVLQLNTNGKVVLESPGILRGDRFQSFPGTVRFAETRSSFLGRRVRISGFLHCRVGRRNPGLIEDKLGIWQRPLLLGALSRMEVEPVEWVRPFSVPNWLDHFFRGRLQNYPYLMGLEHAVWFGDLGFFPPSVKQLYREGGLLQLVALSGQHVIILYLMVRFFLGWMAQFFLRIPKGAQFLQAYRYLDLCLPLAISGLLMLTGRGCAPIKRTLCMALFFALLRFRRLQCGTLQLLCSSVAILILLEPQQVGSCGFMLSVAATALLAEIMTGRGLSSPWRTYFFLSVCMPILMFPLTAFFFCKVSWIAPLCNLLVDWLWDLVLIPLGFLMPIALCLPDCVQEIVLWAINGLVRGILDGHQFAGAFVSATYRTCLRPTWLEVAVSEFLLVALVVWLRKRIFARELSLA
ncbi:MAG: ComEC/Rec2 family competence protein [Deltaproteobacteria bacterium]|nr:ComEC/Rec2 family competence protein [Deltaproteobacteria bacterium]